jgi:hypothetical protein
LCSLKFQTDGVTDPFWRGPKPNPETIFEISFVGDERKWRVKVGTAIKPSCARKMPRHDSIVSD